MFNLGQHLRRPRSRVLTQRHGPPWRVLHAPHSIADNAFVLSEYERKLGFQSELIVAEDSGFAFRRHGSLNLEGKRNFVRHRRIKKFLEDSLDRYDIYHFNFGSSLLHRYPNVMHEDLPYLKAHGKKIFVTYQGCDLRDKELSLRTFTTSACQECTYHSCDGKFNAWKRESIEIASRYADGIYVLNPDLRRSCASAKFLPYASVDVDAIIPPPANTSEKLTLLHAPTSRSVKGSRYVLDAFERICAKYPHVRIALVEGLTHQEALRAYREADIVVDQLLFGWYGAFAVETMALGKPTLAYIRDEDLAYVPPDLAAGLGLYRTSKERLFHDLESMVVSRSLRSEWGEKGRAFVERFHRPMDVAKQVTGDYLSAMAR